WTSSTRCSTRGSSMASASLAPGDISRATVESPSTTRRFWRRLRGERKALIGVAIVAILTFLAVFGPVLAPHDPDADDFALFGEPSMAHPLGTDSFGRDI